MNHPVNDIHLVKRRFINVSSWIFCRGRCLNQLCSMISLIVLKPTNESVEDAFLLLVLLFCFQASSFAKDIPATAKIALLPAVSIAVFIYTLRMCMCRISGSCGNNDTLLLPITSAFLARW